MNHKIIKSILKRKHNEFVASIKDEEIRRLVDKNSIITGGSIASMFLKEPVNDFDYYFTDKETTLKVAKYFVNEFNILHPPKPNSHTEAPHVYTEKNHQKVEDGEDFDRIRIMVKSAGIIGENTDESQYEYFEGRPLEEGEEYVRQSLGDVLEDADELDGSKLPDEDKERYRPVFLTDNAITLANKVQIIIRFYGSPEQIHENYDYVHCTNYWTSKNGELVLRQPALESLLAKELKYVGSKYPLCSLVRMRKFITRGWHINAGQILKIAMQISELDLDNLDVLEDQLTGVDTAYFNQIIQDLRQKQMENENFHIEMPYLCTIIDRLFG